MTYHDNQKINLEPFAIKWKQVGSIEGYIDVDQDEQYNDLDDHELDELRRENAFLLIPDGAIHIGTLSREIENWGTYDYLDDYFIMPINEEQYNWALIRMYWDDNWSIYMLTGEAKCKIKSENYKVAAKFLLEELWKSQEIDLNDDEYKTYLQAIQ